MPRRRCEEQLNGRGLGQRPIQAESNRQALENTILDHPRDSIRSQADPGRDVRRVCHWTNFEVRLERFSKLIAQYSTQSFDHIGVFFELASDLPTNDMYIFLQSNLLARIEIEGGRYQSVSRPLHNFSLFRFAQGISHGSLQPPHGGVVVFVRWLTTDTEIRIQPKQAMSSRVRLQL
jgi:hypothetical protein